MSTLGRSIRNLRKEKGLTQRQLASQIGINFTYLSKIENDRLEQGQSPRLGTLRLIAQALETDFESLCLLAGKVPDSIKQRVLSNPDFFRSTAWLDDEAIGNLLQGLAEHERLNTQEALAWANAFLQGVLDSLPTHIAVLDESGTIIAVNEAWRTFALENGLRADMSGTGSNYLAVCEAADGLSSDGAQAAAKNIRAILAGKRDTYELEYPCHSPNQQRWFVLRVRRFYHYGKVRAVAAHDNVTARKMAEMALNR